MWTNGYAIGQTNTTEVTMRSLGYQDTKHVQFKTEAQTCELLGLLCQITIKNCWRKSWGLKV